mgnify:CR=1 FL=1
MLFLCWGIAASPSAPRNVPQIRILRAKGEAIAAPAVVQRFDPEPVARHKETLLRPVPNSQGEHAVEPLDAMHAPGIVRFEDDLGIAVGDEPIALGFQLSAEFRKVVDRPVVHDHEPQVGGLAGSFVVNGVYLEKFYHHLFTSDRAAADLIERLGLGDKLEWLPTSNSFYANRIYRLSTPFDLLRFSHVSLLDRIPAGLDMYGDAEDPPSRAWDEFVLPHIDPYDRDHYETVWAAVVRRGPEGAPFSE